MNSGRDPDEPGRPSEAERTRGQARWFRTVVVVSLAVVSAVGVAPWTLAAVAQTPVIRRVSGSAPPASDVKPTKAINETSNAKPTREGQPSNGSGEPYWVQVGAYRDVEMARRVAERLREARYEVQESVTVRPAAGTETVAGDAVTTAQGGRDRYEIVVTGSSAGEVGAKLAAKGLASRSSGEGAVITPSLFLGEAVALSRDLSDDGLIVRVRRVGASSP